MADVSEPAPPVLRLPPLVDVTGAAPTANGLLSSQQSPAAVEVAEAQRANVEAERVARLAQRLREARIEDDRSSLVLPAMADWQRSRPNSRRIDYPPTMARLGAVGLAGYSVVRYRGEPRPVQTVAFDAVGHALIGGLLGYGFGMVLRDVVEVSRPPVPFPLTMPTEVRAALVKKLKPEKWRLDGWLVSWGELAAEFNSHAAIGNGADAGFGEVASLVRVMRG